MIDNFEDEYWFLSNFYPVSIQYGSIEYPSVEHAYQAAKTNDILEKWAIARCGTASKAKKYGKMVSLREDWDKQKLSIMKDLLTIKFSKEPLRGQLLATGNQKLVEGNYWGDCFWGVCRGQGENHLGKLLMSIREELQHKSKE